MRLLRLLALVLPARVAARHGMEPGLRSDAAVGITGPHATPKGLRHGFAIKAVISGVPLNVLQKWLGHAALSTTAIYADATGPEAKQLAERMW